jgi:phytoene dehydrogenase-like protein
MLTAGIISSGPKGLSAAVVLAAGGIATTVFERNPQIGGACSTAETTLPNFRQDLGSSIYPMGIASPFFRSLPIDIPWIEPTASCAHPLDDGTAVMLEHSIKDTIDTLEAGDRNAYRSLIARISRTRPRRPWAHSEDPTPPICTRALWVARVSMPSFPVFPHKTIKC